MTKMKLLISTGICLGMTAFGACANLIDTGSSLAAIAGMWGVFAGFFFNEYINSEDDDDWKH